MYFDRIASKQAAKALICTYRPSPVLVTLVFILLTSGVAALVGAVAPSPFDQASYLISEGYGIDMAFPYVFAQKSAPIGGFLAVLISFYSMVIGFGYSKYCLRLTRGEEAGYATLMDGFNMAAKVLLTNILMGVFIALWTMLFVIPGIIAIYQYSQAIYCLIDDPSIGPLEAIRRSKAMMRGQKFNLFALQMTFFGWYFLASVVVAQSSNIMIGMLGNHLVWLSTLVTFVVAAAMDIWLTPYIRLVEADFYNHLVGWRPGRREAPPYQGPELEF